MGLAAASRTLTISAVAPSVAVCAQPARGVLAGWRMTSSAAATAHALLPPRQAVVCATRQAPWVLRVRCASLTSIWRPAAVPPSPPSCSAQRETCRPAVRLSGEQYPVGICRPAVRWAVAPFYSCDAHVLARTSRWNARQFGTASHDAAAEVEAGGAGELPHAIDRRMTLYSAPAMGRQPGHADYTCPRMPVRGQHSHYPSLECGHTDALVRSCA